jgi:hypothetical protein
VVLRRADQLRSSRGARSVPATAAINGLLGTAPVAPTITRPRDESSGPGGPEYEAAKRQWLGSGLFEGSAGQNAALPIAINDLTIGVSTDTGSKVGYPTAIADLATIEHMPDAMVTPQQSAQWDAAAAALDRFFDLPRADPYNVECSLASNTPAATAWNAEPVGTDSGVLAQPLEQAASDLKPQAATNPCYRAAIDDLVALESATKQMIANTAGASYTSDRSILALACEIGYLNQVFEPGALDPSQDRLVSLSR